MLCRYFYVSRRRRPRVRRSVKGQPRGRRGGRHRFPLTPQDHDTRRVDGEGPTMQCSVAAPMISGIDCRRAAVETIRLPAADEANEVRLLRAATEEQGVQ